MEEKGLQWCLFEAMYKPDPRAEDTGENELRGRSLLLCCGIEYRENMMQLALFLA